MATTFQINEQQVLDFLSYDSFLALNKKMLRFFGCANLAVYAAYLIDKHKYALSMGSDSFFLQLKNQEKELGISAKIIRKHKKQLEEFGYLKIKRVGVPARDLYTLDISALFAEILAHHASCGPEVPIHGRLEVPIHGRLNNKNNNSYSNVNISTTISRSSVNSTSSVEEEDQTDSKETKITSKQFDQFISQYPKTKGSEGAAKLKWDTLCRRRNRPSLKTILDAIEAQKKTDRWRDGFIPHPSTWLHQTRWIDDPASMMNDSKPMSRKQANDSAISAKAEVIPELPDFYKRNIKSALIPAIKKLKRLPKSTAKEDLFASLAFLYHQFTNEMDWPKTSKMTATMEAKHMQVLNFQNFVRKYIEWLETNTWIKTISAQTFHPESKLVIKFIEELNQQFGFNIFNGKDL